MTAQLTEAVAALFVPALQIPASGAPSRKRGPDQANIPTMDVVADVRSLPHACPVGCSWNRWPQGPPSSPPAFCPCTACTPTGAALATSEASRLSCGTRPTATRHCCSGRPGNGRSYAQVLSIVSEQVAVSILRASNTPLHTLISALPDPLHLPALAACCPLVGSHRALTLSHNSDSSSRLLQLAASSGIPITWLSLNSSCNWDREQVLQPLTSVLPQLRGLLTLHLQGSASLGLQLGGFTGHSKPVAALADALAQVSSLRELKLEHIRLENADFINFVQRLTTLTRMTTLTLVDSPRWISIEGIAALARCLSCWPALWDLKLSDRALDPHKECLEVLASHAAQLTHLEVLCIRNTGSGQHMFWRKSGSSTKSLGRVVAALPHLKELRLDGGYFEDRGVVPVVQQFSVVTGLQVLDLRVNDIGDRTQQALGQQLSHLVALRELYLDCPNILRLAPGLKALKNLELLCIGDGLHEEDWKLDGEGSLSLDMEGSKQLASCFSSWHNLTKLDMKYCKLQNAGAQALAKHLSALHSLRWWNLQGNALGREGLDALADQFACMTVLEVLKLGWEEEYSNQVPQTPEGIPALTRIMQGATALQTLRLSLPKYTRSNCSHVSEGDSNRCHVSERALTLFWGELAALPGLSSLEVWGVTEYCLPGLAALQRLTGLTYLCIVFSCAMSGKGVTAISGALGSLTRLTELHICDDRIKVDHEVDGEDTPRTFTAGLEKLQGLQRLWLQGCEVGDKELLAMSGTLERLRRLSMLVLTDNALSDCGVRTLASSTSRMRALRVLDLGSGDFSAREVDSLRKVACWCEVAASPTGAQLVNPDQALTSG